MWINAPTCTVDRPDGRDSLRAAPDFSDRVARLQEAHDGDLYSPAHRAFDQLRKGLVDAIPDEAEALDMIEGIERGLSHPGDLLGALYAEAMATVGEGTEAFDDLRKQFDQTGLSRETAEQLVGQGLPLLLSIMLPAKKVGFFRRILGALGREKGIDGIVKGPLKEGENLPDTRATLRAAMKDSPKRVIDQLRGEEEQIKGDVWNIRAFSLEMQGNPNNPRAREIFNTKANEWLKGKLENLSVLAEYPRQAERLGLTEDQLLSAKNYIPGEIERVAKLLGSQVSEFWVEVTRENKDLVMRFMETILKLK